MRLPKSFETACPFLGSPPSNGCDSTLWGHQNGHHGTQSLKTSTRIETSGGRPLSPGLSPSAKNSATSGSKTVPTRFIIFPNQSGEAVRNGADGGRETANYFFSGIHQSDALRIDQEKATLRMFPHSSSIRMAAISESELLRDALNRLYEAKSPVLRGRCLRSILDHRAHSDADFVDLILSIGDPVRQINREEASAIIRAHPGKLTASMENDLRKGIAGDQSRGLLPRNPFSHWK